MDSSKARSAKIALRGAGETILLAAGGFVALKHFSGDSVLLRAAGAGLTAAWLASAVSFLGLLAARSVSPKAFWWAWGSGLALRVVILAALMALSMSSPFKSSSALLLSYAFGVICFLPVEFWNLREPA